MISDENGTTHLDLRLLHKTVPIADAVLTIDAE